MEDAIATAGKYAVVLCGSGNAYVYAAELTGGDTNAITSNMTVELVGVLEGVASGSLTAVNFGILS